MESKTKVNPFNLQQKRFRTEIREVEMGERSPTASSSSDFSLDDEYQAQPIQLHKVKSPLRTKISKSWIRNKGLAYMLGAQLFNCLMNIAITVLEIDGNNGLGFHPVQILFVRMGITIVLASTYMAKKKIEHFPLGAKEVRWLLLARGLGGYVGVFGMYYSLIYLSLADATVLTFISPILGCAVCAHLLNEPFGRMEQLAAAVSFIGVVFIAQPAVIFGYFNPSPTSAAGIVTRALDNVTTHIHAPEHEERVITSHQKVVAIAIALVGCIGGTVVITTLRAIGKRAHPLITVNYFATCATIVSGLACALIPSIGFAAPTTFKEWSLLVFLGMCGFTSQTMSATGMQYENSSRPTNMVFSQMLFSVGGDFLFFGHVPTVFSLIGSSLILGPAVMIAFSTQVIKAEGKEEGRLSITDEERGLLQGMDIDDAESTDVPMQEFQGEALNR